MHEITVDGERYIQAADSGPIQIVVLERGFVYIGRVDEDGESLTIQGARSIIRWGTTKHLGELVNGPLTDTTLGDRCNVKARINQVIHFIEVSQHAWANHCG